MKVGKNKYRTFTGIIEHNISTYIYIPYENNFPILKSEVKCVIQNMENRNAPGFDNIYIEIIKLSEEDSLNLLSYIFNNIPR